MSDGRAPTALVTGAPLTVASLLRARADDQRVGYLIDNQQWTWAEVVAQSERRAVALDRLVEDADHRHVGVLSANSPEYLFLIGGAALAGVTLVGINPTRRGEELARDIRHTDCHAVLVEESMTDLLDGLDLGAAGGRVITLDGERWQATLAAIDASMTAAEPPHDHPLLLLFTSGSTSAPKAVVCSTGRLAGAGSRAAAGYGVTADDVCYLAMPLFHGNALMACWAPALSQGAAVAIRPRFSAGEWLDDVRRFGCTYFTYVGRTIAYVLAQPPTPHDIDHHLRLGFGTEASTLDRERFEARFGCPLVEGYGSSESVISIVRTPDTPLAALGKPRPDDGTDVAVVDPASGVECRRARFDVHGALVNAGEAIGEMVDRSGGGTFEGYYRNPDATADRLRDGWYWTGDLAYRDESGFFYFAGRTNDWLRVDSENFAAAPVEAVLARAPGVVMVAVYAVPDARTGDQVMVAVELALGTEFDPDAFDDFLASQPDLGTKWAPRFVRIVPDMPLTANSKLAKGGMRSEAWACTDPVWWRPARGAPLVPFTAADRATWEAEFASHSRSHLV